MSRHEDRGLLRRTVTDGRQRRKRWGAITDEFKDQAVAALKVALRMALEKSDHRAATSVVQTLAALEGQNQSDEHLDMRLAAGQAEERSGTVKVVIERRTRVVGDSPALPSGPVADDRQRATIQRGDVRPAIGQDNDGGVSGG